MMRWLRGEHGMGGVMEVLLLLGLLGGGGGIGAWFGFGGKEIDKVLEVRPAGAPAMATGITVPENLADTARALPGVSRVVKYLHISQGETSAGPRLVIAGEFSGASLPTWGRVRIREGRALSTEDAGAAVAVVGAAVAEGSASASRLPCPSGAPSRSQERALRWSESSRARALCLTSRRWFPWPPPSVFSA